MIQKNQRFLNLINILSDWILTFLSYIVSSYFWLDVLRTTPNPATVDLLNLRTLLIPALYASLTVFLLTVMRLYNPARVRRLRHDLLTVWKATILVTLFLAMLLYLFRMQEFSRGVLFISLFLSSCLLCAKRFALRRTLSALRQKGYNQKHVIIAGTGELARQYTRDVQDNPDMGFHIAGYVGQEKSDLTNYLGNFDVLESKLQGPDIDEVVVALEPEESAVVRSIILVCEKCGTKISVIPFYNDIIPPSPTIESIGKSKLINIRANPLDNLGFAAIKRGFDILVSLFLLLALSPLLMLLALSVKLSSPGPVFFCQERVGRRKRLFKMYKFRSMRVNAKENSGWTTDHDPRKTRVGSLMRKCSLDELPQLMNVLRGDMSLIGPRPEIPFFVDQFKDSVPLYMVKHQVRPGMTGWAQVNGYRGDTSITKRIEYDIWYIENWSVYLDCKILFLTAFGGWLNREHIQKGI